MNFFYTPNFQSVFLRRAPRLRRQWHVAARGYAMVKSDVLTPRHTPCCSEEDSTGAPSPGHTDDEASDEEGGQGQLSSDDDKKETTMYDQLAARSRLDQDCVDTPILRGRAPPDSSKCCCYERDLRLCSLATNWMSAAHELGRMDARHTEFQQYNRTLIALVIFTGILVMRQQT